LISFGTPTIINIRLQPAETSRLQPSRRSVPGRALARPPVLRIINESGTVTCILVQWIGWMEAVPGLQPPG
jgi:hypothetical protein